MASVDNQGNIVPGTGSVPVKNGQDGVSTTSSTKPTTTAASPTIPSQTANPSESSSPVNAADFGSCSTPQIEFGVGFDSRKVGSF